MWAEPWRSLNLDPGSSAAATPCIYYFGWRADKYNNAGLSEAWASIRSEKWGGHIFWWSTTFFGWGPPRAPGGGRGRSPRKIAVIEDPIGSNEPNFGGSNIQKLGEHLTQFSRLVIPKLIPPW